MENFLRIISLIFISLAFINCETTLESNVDDLKEQPTIKQGVWGVIKFWEGDFMPTIPSGASMGTITGVERQIFIFELTPTSKADMENYGGFYTKINSELITTSKSNSKGFFEIALPEGKYSFFVKENSMLYANSYDSEGNISSFTVKKDSLTKVEFNINYKATY